MGQQQLLLLVLTLVIVGLAVVSGMQTYQDSRRKAKYDQATIRLRIIADAIQVWKRTPEALGGGDNGDPTDFRDFSVDQIGLTRDGVTGGRYSGRAYIIEPDGSCIALHEGNRAGGNGSTQIHMSWHPDGNCGADDNPNWFHPFWIRISGPDPETDIEFHGLNGGYTSSSNNW
ncbi:MAG: hypothetical protein AAGF99_14755 [Bacteroidota bacterium]